MKTQDEIRLAIFERMLADQRYFQDARQLLAEVLAAVDPAELEAAIERVADEREMGADEFRVMVEDASPIQIWHDEDEDGYPQCTCHPVAVDGGVMHHRDCRAS